jgi:hypothetical protein
MSSYLTQQIPSTHQNHDVDVFQAPLKESLNGLEMEMASTLESFNPKPLANTLVINASSSGFDGSNECQITINGIPVEM